MMGWEGLINGWVRLDTISYIIPINDIKTFLNKDIKKFTSPRLVEKIQLRFSKLNFFQITFFQITFIY